MRSMFFNSTEADPREYDAAQFAGYFGAFIGSGVFGSSPDALSVSPGEGLSVTIAPGRVYINGYMGIGDEPEALALPGFGKHSVALRLDLSSERRRIYPIVLAGTDAFPAPERGGNVYDLVIAHVEAASGPAVTVTDTRADYGLCGFAAFTGQPAYQPPADVPALVWDYALFPDSLSAAQRAMVEGSPSYMGQYEASRVSREFRAYTEAGTYTYTAPGTGAYIIEVVGGGGWGQYGGYGGGYAKKLVRLLRGQQVTVTVGAGGYQGNGSGGASSFGAFVSASGGGSGGGGIGGELNIAGGGSGGPSGNFAYVSGASWMSTYGGAWSSGFGCGAAYNDRGTCGCVIVAR